MNYPRPVSRTLLHLNPMSIDSIGMPAHQLLITSVGSWASAAWPAANRILYVPIALYEPTTFVRAFWYNGATADGNIDVGLYDSTGRRLASTGAVAQGTINVLQDVALAVTVGPGQHYIAITSTSATGTFFRGVGPTTPGGLSFNGVGMAQDSGTPGGLPATASMVANAENYLPMFGISTRSFI